FGHTRGLRATLMWSNHPKALPLAVPNSFATAALQAGVDLTIAAPESYLPDAQAQAELTALAAASGSRLKLTSEREAAYDGAHVIYAKSWASPRHYGDA